MTREYQQTHFFDLLLNQAEAEAALPAPVVEAEPEEEAEDAPVPLAPPVLEDLPGRLPPEARRALIALLRHGVVMAESKRLLFEALCRCRAGVQEHLVDMNLRLLLDEKTGIAILLAQGGEDEDGEDNDDGGSLISRRTLSLYDTLLLLVLRKHYQEREAAGEQRVIIDFERIETALRPFLPLTNSSRSDQRQLNGALSNMKDRRILAAVRGEDDRYEITPVIRYVVNAAFLEQMLAEYTQLAKRAGSETNDD